MMLFGKLFIKALSQRASEIKPRVKQPVPGKRR